MADVPQTLSLITLAQNYRDDIVRQINRRVIVLKLFPIVPGEGKNCAWVPEFGSSEDAENYAEGADAANFGSDAQASATLNWGLYRRNFHVTSLAMDTAKSSRTPVGNQALWARNLVNSTALLADKIERDIHVGAGTGTLINGFGNAIGTTGNSYAGIDGAVTTDWNPYVVDPGVATPLSLALVRKDLGSIYDACGEIPDIALVGTQTFNTVGSLFDATRRYVQEIETARGAVRLTGGIGPNMGGNQGAIDVEGCYFVRSRRVPEGRIYYCNTNYAEVEYLPPAGVPDEVYRMVQADDGFGQVLLGMVYEKLAKTGAADKAMVRSTLQLKVRRRNAFGCRKNVALAA